MMNVVARLRETFQRASCVPTARRTESDEAAEVRCRKRGEGRATNGGGGARRVGGRGAGGRPNPCAPTPGGPPHHPPRPPTPWAGGWARLPRVVVKGTAGTRCPASHLSKRWGQNKPRARGTRPLQLSPASRTHAHPTPTPTPLQHAARIALARRALAAKAGSAPPPPTLLATAARVAASHFDALPPACLGRLPPDLAEVLLDALAACGRLTTRRLAVLVGAPLPAGVAGEEGEGEEEEEGGGSGVAAPPHPPPPWAAQPLAALHLAATPGVCDAWLALIPPGPALWNAPPSGTLAPLEVEVVWNE